jgi:hypothetical protein
MFKMSVEKLVLYLTRLNSDRYFHPWSQSYFLVTTHSSVYCIFTSAAFSFSFNDTQTRYMIEIYKRHLQPLQLSISGSTALCCAVAPFSVLWRFTQSVGLLGREISPSQGRYLHTGHHKHRINTHRHPCLKWDSNPRSQCLSGRRQFMV